MYSSTARGTHPSSDLPDTSGEGFVHPGDRGIATDAVLHLARQTYQAARHGVQIAIVIGGGNILRGAQFTSGNSCVGEATAHYMGMLATVINGLALQDALEKQGMQTRVQTAISMHEVAEPYILRRAVRHLEKGRVVIFAAGTGNPYFTTDTAAVLRAQEVHAQVLLKATKVDGLFEADPVEHPDAAFIASTSYMKVLEKQLKVMDMTAISLAMDNDLPLIVFNLKESNNILKAICGERVGTIIAN